MARSFDGTTGVKVDPSSEIPGRELLKDVKRRRGQVEARLTKERK